MGSFMIADETGIMRITCWHGQTDKMAEVKEGDIVKITNGYVRDNNGRAEVHLNDQSGIELNPSGETVTVGDKATLAQAQADAQRKKISELGETDNNVEIRGTKVQVFEPRFFEVCPQCGKRATQEEDQSNCQVKKSRNPA